MYTINSPIASHPFNKLDVENIVKTDMLEILSVSLEKDAIFPEHNSPSDPQLIVLEGDIVFHTNGKPFHLREQRYLNFPKEVADWIKANENSKFLNIR